MKYTVVILENQTLFSQALASLVNQFKEFKVLYYCKNSLELFKKLEMISQVPNLLLVDIDTFSADVMSAISKLKKEYPSIYSIALSKDKRKKKVLSALSSGIRGYIPKDIEKNMLERVLREVIHTGFFYTPEVSNLLVEALHPQRNKENQLKEREIEFLKQACTEKTYKEIAKEMCLSPKTIEGYRDAVFEKLNLKNRTGMVLYAIKNDIIQV